MPEVIVQVVEKTPRQENAQGRTISAKLIGPDGTKYTIAKDKQALYGMIQEGLTYKLFYEDGVFNDKPFKSVQRATLVEGSTAPAENGKLQDPFQKRPTNPVDAQRMFIAGAINAALHGSGLAAIEATELGRAIDVLELVWRSKKSLGRERTPAEQDLDDDLPY